MTYLEAFMEADTAWLDMLLFNAAWEVIAITPILLICLCQMPKGNDHD